MRSGIQILRKGWYALAAILTALPGAVVAQQGEQASSGLEEVIVTAERRVSTVQDTAAAITAFTGEELNRLGLADAADLSKLSPGVFATPGGNIMQIYVRGVGNFAGNAFAEGAVAFNVDGVYISRPNTYQGLFFDLERIEVLKGPQGTLYGRNATGGAINLISARPEIGGEVGGYLNGELGNYEAVTVNGAANIPVSDSFALRGAVQVLERDGYFDDGGDDASSISGRLSALFEPGDDASLLVVADFQSIDSAGTGGTISGTNPFAEPSYLTDDPWDVGTTSPEANAALAMFGRAPLGDPPMSRDQETWGIMAELNWDLGFGTLTAIPAYRDVDNRTTNYAPGFLIDVDEQSDQTSFEARLASNEPGFVDWVGGVYYFDEAIQSDSLFLQQLVFAEPGKNSTNLVPDLDTEAWAVFGQLTFNLTDRTRLIAGVRYTDENKKMSGFSTTNSPPPGSPPRTFPLVGDESWNETTWKVGLEYDVADQNLLYFNIGTGFKAGGFYAEQQQFGNSFEPETLTAYALGSKNRFLENRVQLNVEAFYWDYEDHQESHLALSPGFYSLFITENIGQAEIKGLDVESEILVGDNALLSLQLQYLDAEFTEFAYTGFSPAGPPVTTCPVAPLGGPFYNVNCDGFNAIRAPEWAGSVAYLHSFPLANGSRVQFYARMEFADETFTSIDYIPAALSEDYTRSDASLTWYSADDRYYVGAWIRNIEDDPVVMGGFLSPFTSLTYSQLKSPRTYGISFGLNF